MAAKPLVNRKARAQRFTLGNDVFVFMRAKGTRAYTFEMALVNISRNGLLLRAKSDPLIPFEIGVELSITLDLACRLFSHPVVVTGRIARRENGALLGLGIELIQIEERHRKTFDAGLAAIGDPKSEEH